MKAPESGSDDTTGSERTDGAGVGGGDVGEGGCGTGRGRASWPRDGTGTEAGQASRALDDPGPGGGQTPQTPDDTGPGLDEGRRHLALWGTAVPVVGVVHLLPLPGAPRWGGSMSRILDRALEDARKMAVGGLDGILVENFGDVPFFPETVPAETVAAMTRAVAAVADAVSVPVGLNVLRNDANAAMSIATACGARFVRVNVHTGTMYTDQGPLRGRAHETLRLRRSLGVDVSLLADVMVKHAVPPAGLTLRMAARDAYFRGLADGLIVTGDETGDPLNIHALGEVKKSLPAAAKVWAGSGVTPQSAAEVAANADGIIVGSALQAEGRAGAGVEASRVRAFMRALGRG